VKLLDIIRTASSNTLRSKLRTSLTVIAIFIDSFTLTLTNGLGSSISTYIDAQINNLGAKDVLVIRAGDSSVGGGDTSDSDKPKEYDASKKIATTSFGIATTVLTDNDITKIKKVAGIKSVEPNLALAPDYIASGLNDKKYQISANPYITGTKVELASGEQLNNDSTEINLLLPVEYVEVLGYTDNQDAINKKVEIGVTDGTGLQRKLTATIKGVQQKGVTNAGGMNTNTALTNAIYKAQTNGLPASTINSYTALVAKFDANYSKEQIDSLKKDLKDKGYAATTFEEQIGSFKQVIEGIVLVLNAFAVIALLAASFGIINTLLMSVQERTKEIGLMKAMGMSSSKIFMLFSAEAVMLGFWGSFIGVVVAQIVGRIINSIVSNGILKDLAGLTLLSFPLQSTVTIVLIVMVIAFLAGTLPAFRAARQNPIDSLRYE
jgi:putative ABC transport system permease protein